MLVATRRKCWVSPSWYNMTLVIPQSLAPPHQFTPLLNSFSGLAGGQVTSPLPTWNTEISKHWDVPVVDFVVCVCVCVLEVYSGTDPKLQSNNLIFQDNLPDLIWARCARGIEQLKAAQIPSLQTLWRTSFCVFMALVGATSIVCTFYCSSAKGESLNYCLLWLSVWPETATLV